MTTRRSACDRAVVAWLCVAAFGAASCAGPGANSRSTAARLAASVSEGRPVSAPDADLTMEDARRVRSLYVSSMRGTWGRRVGYKAALTNPAAQDRFGVDGPISGSLHEHMLFPSGSVLSPALGARLMTEGDLMVRVGRDGIEAASTPREALAYIDAVIPFLEIPDLVYEPGTELTGPMLAAINAGARAGVLGDPVPIEDTDAWFDRLGSIQVEILDEAGEVSGFGASDSLMGHPMNVVIWLRDSLAREGKTLKPGDLLSLGTITPLQPVEPGSTVRIRYVGLDPGGPIEVSVSFDEL